MLGFSSVSNRCAKLTLQSHMTRSLLFIKTGIAFLFYIDFSGQDRAVFPLDRVNHGARWITSMCQTLDQMTVAATVGSKVIIEDLICSDYDGYITLGSCSETVINGSTF